MDTLLLPLFIAVAFGSVVYILYSLLFAGKYAASSGHTKHALDQIYEESKDINRPKDEIEETLEILKADINESAALKFLSVLPFGKRTVVKLVKAGMQQSAGGFMLFIGVLILAALFAVKHFGLHPAFYILAFIVPLWLGYRIISGRIKKRNDKFIDMFPDVLDMIVRSVKSGFPLNTALSMVSENMEDPVREEFAQVSDELALGRSLSEALERLALRIEEPDIRFFVVVLKIQQDTGGNLAEVITNLSGVIRKRKQLRRKIKAMTAEGRVTGYILSAIPILLFCVLLYSAPKHLDPLFHTSSGNMVLATSVGLIILAQIIVRKMIDIDI